jgi:transcriptional regulator with XRE-family HTH domain
MITPEQSRAARAWLNWSQDELAKRASVSVSTIKDFERGERTPIRNNLEALRQAFAAAGVTMAFREGGMAAGIGWRDPGEPAAPGSA